MKPRIAVIGDSFLDVTYPVSVRGPSPEAENALVLRPSGFTEYDPGGAGNVAAWLSLAGECTATLYAPWGAFSRNAEEYATALQGCRVRLGMPPRNSDECAVKERMLTVLDTGSVQHHFRMDSETLAPLTRAEELFVETALANEPYDAIVLVDYDKWTFRDANGDKLRVFLKTYAHFHRKPVFINSKQPERWTGFGATTFLCNLQEAQTLEGYDLEDAVSKINADLVIVTMGKEGAHSFLKRTGADIRGESNTRASDVVDVTGAGDAFLAGFVATSLANHWWKHPPKIQEELIATTIQTGHRWAARCVAQVGVGDPTKRLSWEGNRG